MADLNARNRVVAQYTRHRPHHVSLCRSVNGGTTQGHPQHQLSNFLKVPEKDLQNVCIVRCLEKKMALLDDEQNQAQD